MQLKLLSTDQTKSVLEFEAKNKDYFELYVPPRPNEYFTQSSLHNIIKSLCKEQDRGECYLYLAYNNDQLIGRANLVNIQDGTAELGYRLCQTATGQGHATQIVANLIKIAKSQLSLSLIKAHTTTDNLASIRVLEKNNFKHIKTKQNAATLNGKSLNFTYFELEL